MKTNLLAIMAVLSVPLAACGGGGGSVNSASTVAPTPIPTPTPAPTPTPTPVPTPTPAPIDITISDRLKLPIIVFPAIPIANEPTSNYGSPAQILTLDSDYDSGILDKFGQKTNIGSSFYYDSALDEFSLTVIDDHRGDEIFKFSRISGDHNTYHYKNDKVSGVTDEKGYLNVGWIGIDYGNPSIVTEGDWRRVPLYVQNGQFIKYDGEGSGAEYKVMDFIFGSLSYPAQVPKSGGASYALIIQGTRVEDVVRSPLIMHGEGFMRVDFASGDIALQGNILTEGMVTSEALECGCYTDTGVINAEAKITSSIYKYKGTFTATEPRFDPEKAKMLGVESDPNSFWYFKTDDTITYTGDLTGWFYGPEAEDVGGLLRGKSLDGYGYNATFIGSPLPRTNAGDSLSNLDGTNILRTVSIGVRDDDLPTCCTNRNLDTFSYNKDNNVYILRDASTMSSPIYGGFVSLYSKFGSGDRVPSRDRNNFSAYATSIPSYYSTASEMNVLGSSDTEVDLFDGSADGIELTYTSFVHATSKDFDKNGVALRDRYNFGYVAFGKSTAPDQMPTSGTANYAGLVFGDRYDATGITGSLRGTSQMSVDFLSGDLTSTLTTTLTDMGGKSSILDPYVFFGKVEGFSGLFNATLYAGEGLMWGRFYGDVAQEYASSFKINDPVIGTVIGINVGKKQ